MPEYRHLFAKFAVVIFGNFPRKQIAKVRVIEKSCNKRTAQEKTTPMPTIYPL